MPALRGYIKSDEFGDFASHEITLYCSLYASGVEDTQCLWKVCRAFQMWIFDLMGMSFVGETDVWGIVGNSESWSESSWGKSES